MTILSKVWCNSFVNPLMCSRKYKIYYLDWWLIDQTDGIQLSEIYDKIEN